MEQMQRTRQEIEAFRAQQEIWKQRERLALEQEDRYLLLLSNRSSCLSFHNSLFKFMYNKS